MLLPPPTLRIKVGFAFDCNALRKIAGHRGTHESADGIFEHARHLGCRRFAVGGRALLRFLPLSFHLGLGCSGFFALFRHLPLRLFLLVLHPEPGKPVLFKDDGGFGDIADFVLAVRTVDLDAVFASGELLQERDERQQRVADAAGDKERKDEANGEGRRDDAAQHHERVRGVSFYLVRQGGEIGRDAIFNGFQKLDARGRGIKP